MTGEPIKTITGLLYGVSASVLGAWLALHDWPLIPIIAGIGMGAAIMIRIGAVRP